MRALSALIICLASMFLGTEAHTTALCTVSAQINPRMVVHGSDVSRLHREHWLHKSRCLGQSCRAQYRLQFCAWLLCRLLRLVKHHCVLAWSIPSWRQLQDHEFRLCLHPDHALVHPPRSNHRLLQKRPSQGYRHKRAPEHYLLDSSR